MNSSVQLGVSPIGLMMPHSPVSVYVWKVSLILYFFVKKKICFSSESFPLNVCSEVIFFSFRVW